MSGSIGMNRIDRINVRPTCDEYISNVCNKFPHFRCIRTAGSYNTSFKPDHGDIDLVVFIDDPNTDLSTLRKKFKKHIDENCTDYCVPFREGHHIGEYTQQYGGIVTCAVPIPGQPGEAVQVDNIITNDWDQSIFAQNFLNMSAQMQSLILGVVRVIPIHHKVKFFEHLGRTYPILANNVDVEFVMSTMKMTARKVTYTDDTKRVVVKQEEMFSTSNWEDVVALLRQVFGSDITRFTTNYALEHVGNTFTDDRTRRRIFGIIRSMINIGPGEVGTPKGNEKHKWILDVRDYFGLPEN